MNNSKNESIHFEITAKGCLFGYAYFELRLNWDDALNYSEQKLNDPKIIKLVMNHHKKTIS